MLRPSSELLKFTPVAENEIVGAIHDLYIDDRSWVVRYLVLELGNWSRTQRVLVPTNFVAGLDDFTLELKVSLTAQELLARRMVECHPPVSLQEERAMNQLFGWPAYWSPSTPPNLATPGCIDPDLRSVREILGYTVQATDGGSGEMTDVILDAEGWTIRYLVVDLLRWIPGRRTLIPTTVVQTVDWALARVTVSLGTSAILTSPEFGPSSRIDRVFETELCQHYSVQGHWETPSSTSVAG